MLVIFVIMNFVGTVYGTAWALFSEDRLDWSGLLIGLSLSAFGKFHAGAQALLTGPAEARLGERWALIAGLACEITALIILGLPWAGLACPRCNH